MVRFGAKAHSAALLQVWLMFLKFVGTTAGDSAMAFGFDVDWGTGGAATTLPVHSFAVRKLEAFVWPTDNRTYAYADIVNYSDPYLLSVPWNIHFYDG